MYFEEPWFEILCFRLNCPRNISMTTSASNVNLDDVEEGEIQDDDESVASPENGELLKQPEYPGPLFNKLFNGFEDAPRQSSFPFSEQFRPAPSQHLSPHPAKSRGRDASSFPKVNRSVNGRPNGNRRRRFRNRPRLPRILPRRAYNRTRRLNVENRSRAATPYEESLREFQLRQERIWKKSKPLDRRPARSNAVGSGETSSSGSSLLKRLVGSGSVGIKVLDENGPSEPKKNIPPCAINSPKTGHLSTDILTKVEDIPVPDGLNESTTNTSLVKETPDSSRDIELEVPKTLVNSHEAVSDSSLDLDDELIKLRMEALKTAVLKKHSERLKRGYVPKKTNKLVDDSMIDSLIEEVVSIKEFDLDKSSISVSSSHERNKHSISDNSDMSMDSNYVSDDDTLGQNHVTSTASSGIKSEEVSGAKRPHEEEEEADCKRQKTEEYSQDSSDLNRDNVIDDLNDEELELRALALQSFLKGRKALKDSDNESDKVSGISEQKSEDVLPSVNDKMEQLDAKPERIRKDSESWEELDEDILRAQLLKTLSASLPGRITQDTKHDFPGQITSKTTFSKKEIDAELEVQSKRWSEMMVPKLVISLGSDSESEPENPARDFVKSLDLLLLEAKEKSENATSLSNSKTETKPKVKKKNSPKFPAKKPLLKKGPSGTPTAVKHLPIQQQEEYRRLKLKLAEKLKINLNKISPNASPAASRTQSPMRSQAHTSNSLVPSDKGSQKSNVKVTTKSNAKIVNTSSVESGKKSSAALSTLKSKPLNVPLKSRIVVNKKTEIINKIVGGVTKNDSVADLRKLVLKSKVPIVSTPSTKVPAKPLANLPAKINSSVLSSSSVSSISTKNNVKALVKGALTRKQPNLNNPVLPSKKLIPYSANKLKDEGTKKLLVSPRNNEVKEKPTSLEEKKPLLSNNIGSPAQKDGSNRLQILKLKEVECSSDKENTVAKNNDNTNKLKSEDRIEEEKRLPLNECEVTGGATLLEKLKSAERDYADTLVLISRLERELEEAKKTLSQQGRAVEELKELVKGPSGQASLSVKVTNEDVSAKVVTGDKAQPTVAIPTERCWDPDGVLCPYQLAGCCKDSSCTFLHIHS